MLFFGLNGNSGSGGSSLGFTEYDACANNVGGVPMGSACTLPDGSNIAIWNGSLLTAPDGSAIDGVNVSALLAAGWAPGLVLGASGGGGTATPGSPNSQGSGTPWWSTLITAATKGVATGVTAPKPVVAPAPTNFLTTPTGIGVIAAGVILLIVLLKK